MPEATPREQPDLSEKLMDAAVKADLMSSDTAELARAARAGDDAKMKRLMKAAKIPAEFLPHSTRAAGMVRGKTQGMTDDEVCTRSNVSRPTYVKYYERQIRKAAYQPPSGIT